MKPEEFAHKFMQTATAMGCTMSPSGNVVCPGGKNISAGKAAAVYKRYGDGVAKVPSVEFRNEPHSLKLFRSIAAKALG
ncbi:hypothetical protein [Nitratidesulfovibrio sp. 1201_IL3209]|uniref:hypothetical protein n=1 Tax=Nitratidesulfovibrio sp. 1201_IL3209 TaxID=3084053 RepID=UPI002FDA2E2A